LRVRTVLASRRAGEAGWAGRIIVRLPAAGNGPPVGVRQADDYDELARRMAEQ